MFAFSFKKSQEESSMVLEGLWPTCLRLGGFLSFSSNIFFSPWMWRGIKFIDFNKVEGISSYNGRFFFL